MKMWLAVAFKADISHPPKSQPTDYEKKKVLLSQCMSNVMLRQNVLSHYVACFDDNATKCDNNFWSEQKESEWWPDVVTAASHLLQSSLSSLWNCQIQGWDVEVGQQSPIIYNCQECDFGCSLKNTLRMHKSNHQETWRSLICDHFEMDKKARVSYWSWPVQLNRFFLHIFLSPNMSQLSAMMFVTLLLNRLLSPTFSITHCITCALCILGTSMLWQFSVFALCGFSMRCVLFSFQCASGSLESAQYFTQQSAMCVAYTQ